MKHHWKRELAAALRNPIVFDEGIEACRNACVGGATIVSAVMTIAAYCDSPLTGLPALRSCLERLVAIPLELECWCKELAVRQPEVAGEADFAPGFGYVNHEQARFLHGTCARLAARCTCRTGPLRAQFYLRHHVVLENVLGPLNLVGLSALAFADHGVGIDEAERCFLLWRIRPAIAEAQIAKRAEIGDFPFQSERFEYEGPWPKARGLDLAELEKAVGLV